MSLKKSIQLAFWGLFTLFYLYFVLFFTAPSLSVYQLAYNSYAHDEFCCGTGDFGSSAGCSKQICMAEYFWTIFGQLMSVYHFSALLAWGLDNGGLDLSHHVLWQIPRNIKPKLIQLNERSLNDKKLSSWNIKQINGSKTSRSRNMTGYACWKSTYMSINMTTDFKRLLDA